MASRFTLRNPGQTSRVPLSIFPHVSGSAIMAKRCLWVTCVGDDLCAGTEITNDCSRGVHQRLRRIYLLVPTESGLSSIDLENSVWEHLDWPRAYIAERQRLFLDVIQYNICCMRRTLTMFEWVYIPSLPRTEV
jgi:hypothetical protein